MRNPSRAIRFLEDFGSIAKGIETNKLDPVLCSKLVKNNVAVWVTPETEKVQKAPKNEKKNIQRKPKNEKKK